MGTIANMRSGQQRMLAELTVIGRAPTCDIRLTTPEVSAEHAAIRWTEQRWRIVDLGSRNGTWVGGRRLDASESLELLVGAPLCFGGPEDVWALRCDAEPVAFVRGRDGDRALGSGVALPSKDEPCLQLWSAADGTWVVEDEAGRRAAEDREILRVAGQRFRIYLPAPVARTETIASALAAVEDARLVIEHDSTEEHVTAALRSADGQLVDLGSRAHNAMLLELARARLEDRARGIDAAEEGWIHREELSRRLNVGENHVNILIYRLRRQLIDKGVVDAADVVERRARSGLLRVGPAGVSVRRIGEGVSHG